MWKMTKQFEVGWVPGAASFGSLGVHSGVLEPPGDLEVGTCAP
jgi:hypothetical protein